MIWKVVLLILVLAYSANAHLHVDKFGRTIDASWIEEQYPRCCGEEDCQPVPASDIHVGPKGYTALGTIGTLSPESILPSKDNRYWVCADKIDSYLLCIFKPPLYG